MFLFIEDAYGDAPPPPTCANEPLREDRHLRFFRCYNREVSESYWKVHKYSEEHVADRANKFTVSIPILSKNHAKTGPGASPGGPHNLPVATYIQPVSANRLSSQDVFVNVTLRFILLRLLITYTIMLLEPSRQSRHNPLTLMLVMVVSLFGV